jgi:hypothetical protein
MIAITKGNPTPEEVAALVAVLALVSRTTKPRITSSPAGQWRRSTSFEEVNTAALSRRGRHWKPSSAGWSRVGPGHIEPHSGGDSAHLRRWSRAVDAI